MARTTKNTKKAPAPTAPAPEAHLDPGQLADMDDAISAEPVIPSPPEPEGQEDPQDTPEQPQEQPTGQEGQEDTPEPFNPYEATVAVPLVVIRRGTVPRPEDKPIGTMARGARVAVTNSLDGYAILTNGTYVKEVYLERVKP